MAPHVIIAENPRSGSGPNAALIDSLERDLRLTGREVLRLKDPAAIRAALLEAQQVTDPGDEAEPSLVHRHDPGVSESDAEPPLAPPGTSPSPGFEGVIAAGGDGTVSMLSDWLRPTTPLAILPLGTENLLARHFEFPTGPREFVERWCFGPRIWLDAGLANGKMFLVMASVGFDADVVTRLHRERAGHIRHWSYFKPLWRSIKTYRYPELRIVTDNHERPIKARWAWIFNVPRYAMGLPIAPDANGHDGKLDLCTLRGGQLLRGIVYFLGIVLRRHRGWRDTHVERATHMRIESDEPVPYQIDGDPGGELPLEIAILPRRLTLVDKPAQRIAAT
ncbi:MAG: hypothetical protein KDA83_18185 [Planctomycetales bacterium]|nr:hypothetical protein [Planctomycetales bacterium]